MPAYFYLFNGRVIIHFHLLSISLIFLLCMTKYVPDVETVNRFIILYILIYLS